MKKHQNIKWYILLFSALVSCGKKANQPEEGNKDKANIIELTPAQVNNAGIQTAALASGNMTGIVTLRGHVEIPPQNNITVSIPFGGYLKTTSLLPGMKVRRGEIIATVEDAIYIQLQENFLASQIAFENSEREFERQKQMKSTGATSDKTFQEMQADYESKKIVLKSASEKLKLAGIDPSKLTGENISRIVNIKAPVTGYITTIETNAGKYISPSGTLCNMVNPDDIHLVLTAFEKDISSLKTGQKLRAYTNTEPDKKYDCEIILIGKEISNEGSIQIHCHFTENDIDLIPGTFMNAELQGSTSGAYVVPNTAIVHFEGKDYMYFQLSAGKYRMTQVHPGITRDSMTEVGFAGNEIPEMPYVSRGAYPLLMAAKNKEE